MDKQDEGAMTSSFQQKDSEGMSLRHETVMKLINMGIGIHMEVRPNATDEQIEAESKNIRAWAEETANEILRLVAEEVERMPEASPKYGYESGFHRGVDAQCVNIAALLRKGGKEG